MQENKSGKKVFTFIIIALAIVAAGIFYLLSNSNSNTAFAFNDGYDIYRASLTEAKAAFDQDSALFVDVRSEDAYNTSHIPDAIVIPLEDLPGNEPPVDKDALIFTYCT